VWDRVLAVNVKGTFFCTRYAAPHMKRQGAGAIVNIASIGGMGVPSSSIAYGASKAAIINMTKDLARALAPEIRVNAISPGVVDTRWSSAAWVEQATATTPLRRVASAEDVAAVVLGLVEQHTFITGQVVVVDGGRMLL
jgi:3-oxoacyl-[acyl-carrier protein] reductase